MLVDKDIATDFHEDRKVIEGLDKALQLLTGHEPCDNPYMLLAGLIEELILDVERCFGHLPLL